MILKKSAYFYLFLAVVIYLPAHAKSPERQRAQAESRRTDYLAMQQGIQRARVSSKKVFGKNRSPLNRAKHAGLAVSGAAKTALFTVSYVPLRVFDAAAPTSWINGSYNHDLRGRKQNLNRLKKQ